MNIKNLLLGIVIAIIFFMFCVFGTKLIYNSPERDNFCNDTYFYPAKIPQVCNTSAELQNRINECYNENGIPRFEYDDNGCEKNLECDFCSREFDKADKEYTKNLFVISLIISLIIIVFSVIFIKISSVSGGLMAGSIFFIIYGTANYWRFMEDLFRFIILGVVLGVLIWLAYYISKKNFKIKNKKRK